MAGPGCNLPSFLPCQRVKARLPQHPTLQRPIENGPLNHVHINLFGPYARNLSKRARADKDQKVYVVAMVDYFTKVAELHPVNDKSAMTVARAF